MGKAYRLAGVVNVCGQPQSLHPVPRLEGRWTRVPASISLPFRPTERHAADMVGAIDWTFIVQAAAAAFTAIAAWAAWRAAKASRDAVRDQQIAALIGDLNDLHESLTTLGRVLADDPALYHFGQQRPGLGRHLAVIDMPLPHTEELWRTSVPDAIEEAFEAELHSTHARALREVEDALAKVRRKRGRWWRRRRMQRVNAVEERQQGSSVPAIARHKGAGGPDERRG
jgi:hypothetical protein